MISTPHSSPTAKKYRRLTLATTLLGAALLAACNQADNSTASQTPPAPKASVATAPSATAATPAATLPSPAVTAPSASPTATPATAPATVTAAHATEAAPGGQGKQSSTMNHLSVVATKATPTPDAAPTPPPAPTPEIKIENGKIVQQWQAPAEFASQTSPVKKKPNAVKIGQAYYEQVCSTCHGKEGLGNGELSKLGVDKGAKQATNLASQVVQANTDGELFYKVSNARPPHPKLQQRLTDEQRWYIVSFLRTMKPGKKK